MTTSHTPEPWTHEGPFVDAGSEDAPVACCVSPLFVHDIAAANAARISACVNACAGMANEQLENFSACGGFAQVVRAWDTADSTLTDQVKTLTAEKCDLKADINVSMRSLAIASAELSMQSCLLSRARTEVDSLNLSLRTIKAERAALGDALRTLA
jgi:hypothetical protein